VSIKSKYGHTILLDTIMCCTLKLDENKKVKICIPQSVSVKNGKLHTSAMHFLKGAY